jgi:hypothetical protein
MSHPISHDESARAFSRMEELYKTVKYVPKNPVDEIKIIIHALVNKFDIEECADYIVSRVKRRIKYYIKMEGFTLQDFENLYHGKTRLDSFDNMIRMVLDYLKERQEDSTGIQYCTLKALNTFEIPFNVLSDCVVFVPKLALSIKRIIERREALQIFPLFDPAWHKLHSKCSRTEVHKSTKIYTTKNLYFYLPQFTEKLFGDDRISKADLVKRVKEEYFRFVEDRNTFRSMSEAKLALN